MKKAGYRIISVLGIGLAIGGLIWGVLSLTRMDLKKVFISEFEGTAVTVSIEASEDIYIEGVWDISITQGPASLKIYDSPEEVNKLKISHSAEKLSLSTDRPGFGIGRGIRAELSLPSPAKLEIHGGAQLLIKEIAINDFKLQTEGACSIQIVNSKIENLRLTCKGASSVEADSSKITNAFVDLEGANNVQLGMNGGTLDGSIRGVGHLAYTGVVTTQTINTEGLAKVERK